MQRPLFFKILLIGLLFMGLMIPLGMIQSLVYERMGFRDEARRSIAESWTGEQQVIGPVLALPYRETRRHQVWDTNLKQYRDEAVTEQKTLFLLPETLTVDGTLQTEERRRGLYGVPVYTAEMTIAGSFDTAHLPDLPGDALVERTFDPAYVTLLVSDLRGIVEQPRLDWGGRSLEFAAGSGAFSSMAGMHGVVGTITPDLAQTIPFSTRLTLRGMARLDLAPVGKDTRVRLASNWPHPSFTGRYLPREHEIGDQGFSALWQASSFSSGIGQNLAACADGDCTALSRNGFGVAFVTPVDIYQMSERSAKYGELFVGLTFLAFFLFEVLRRLRLHPMQYLLVGLALSLFYLLLVAFSEHLGFGWAYLIATLACTTLLSGYIAAILDSRWIGLAFAGKFGLLYGMLYLILCSEDNALILGSGLVFLVLALVMVITRRVDWYAVGGQMAQSRKTAD